MNITNNIKKLKIAFVGLDDWKRVRDMTILKMAECKTEEDFTFILKAILGSMFKNEKEIDAMRKSAGLEMLSNMEKVRIIKLIKEKK